jgi:hypothetical protein
VQDLHAKREKLLLESADCDLIANLATDPKKRETFRHLSRQLKKLAADIGVEIGIRENVDGQVSPVASSSIQRPS